jgi:hypothetical protein
MTLFEKSMEPVIMMEKTRTADGEGGFITQWTEGAEFQAAITFDGSLQARVAEKQGVTSIYTVTTSRTAGLEYHDVFKRVSDNKIFRVTSDGDDKLTPDFATFSFSQVSAEEWALT